MVRFVEYDKELGLKIPKNRFYYLSNNVRDVLCKSFGGYIFIYPPKPDDKFLEIRINNVASRFARVNTNL